MRKLLTTLAISLLPLACSTTATQTATPKSTPTPAATPPAKAEPAAPTAPAAAADFGKHWSGVTVRVEPTDESHGLGDGMALASFDVLWTHGQKAGVLYPKKFIDTKTKKEVPMDFKWDNGGNIKAGVYDVLVDHDGRLGKGWLRNVRLSGPQKLHVVVNMNACMLALPLTTYRDVVVYPAGTYADYKARGMLDSIPDEDAISWYNSENKGNAALAPAGKVDLKLVHTDGTVEWKQAYELPANSKLRAL